MKNILFTITILFTLLSLCLTPIYSQQEDIGTDITQEQENNEEEIDTILEEQDVSEEEDFNIQIQQQQQTLDEVLNQENEDISFPLNFFQILVALLAPATFFLIVYLLIKKFKL